jgi:hypothetical protein
MARLRMRTQEPGTAKDVSGRRIVCVPVPSVGVVLTLALTFYNPYYVTRTCDPTVTENCGEMRLGVEVG